MKMSFPKSSNTGPEKWAPSLNGSNSSVRSFGSAAGAPPLRRQTLNVRPSKFFKFLFSVSGLPFSFFNDQYVFVIQAPSRLEVLSSSTAPLYKKPYWFVLFLSVIFSQLVSLAFRPLPLVTRFLGSSFYARNCLRCLEFGEIFSVRISYFRRDLSRTQITPSVVVDGANGSPAPARDVQRVKNSEPVKVSEDSDKW